MLKTFSELARNVHLKPNPISIDNAVFQLHYRLTFWIFLACTILVSSRQYIGEHIRCISDSVANHVINTFCFFTTTFTVTKYFNETGVAHPGVGPVNPKDFKDGSVIHHAYYQWVPFVLFAQALMFYLPHRLWRALEGGTVRHMVAGLENSFLALEETEFITRFGTIPSTARVHQRIEQIRGVFLSRLRLNRYWGYQLIGCELLNVLNLLLQWIFTDMFLGGRFLNLGSDVLKEAKKNSNGPDPLDVVFPKVTKCTFYKYGPSGTIQLHDALCVMALNVINEKIYTFLWFWFVFLTTATLLGMLWRLATMVCFSRSLRFSTLIFRGNLRHDPGLANDFALVIRHCEFSHWLFLYYLSKNLHSRTCDELFRNLALEWRDELLMLSPLPMAPSDSPSLRMLSPNGFSYKDSSTLPLSGPGSVREPLLESNSQLASRRGSAISSVSLEKEKEREKERDREREREKEKEGLHHE